MGKVNLSKLLVIDVESTCEKDKLIPNSEIIEIGIAQIDLKNLTIGSDSIYVIPTLSPVSDFCTELTGITESVLIQYGISFAEACKYLKRNYNSNNTTWASWGDYDRKMFERNCSLKNVGYPFGPRHINIKNLYSIIKRYPEELSVSEALRYEDREFIGRPYTGLDDAYNIACIMANLLAEY